MNGGEPMIATTGLGRSFDGKWAVRDLSLAIGKGELYGFLGQNGAGKTTTLRLLTGLLRPSEGTLRIAGMDHRADGARLRQVVGFVPDTPPLYDYLTGRQHTALVASLWNVDRRTRDERAERFFDVLGLRDAIDEPCKAASHGTRKKIHLAAVLTTAPQVLLLDEPTTGLDPMSTRRLKDLLLEECARGTTVMLSTHVLEIAEQVCDRVGILAHGRLRAQGTVAELRQRFGDGSLEDVFVRTMEKAESTDDGPAAR